MEVEWRMANMAVAQRKNGGGALVIGWRIADDGGALGKF